MDWLTTCYFKGLGVEVSSAMGLCWLGEAAAQSTRSPDSGRIRWESAETV